MRTLVTATALALSTSGLVPLAVARADAAAGSDAATFFPPTELTPTARRCPDRTPSRTVYGTLYDSTRARGGT